MFSEILSNNSIHLYDVANFDEGANSAHHDFSSMYSRNVERQLDDIAEMQLSKEKELSMNFHSFCANLEGLWKYAKIDLKFDYPYYNRSVNMLASYVSYFIASKSKVFLRLVLCKLQAYCCEQCKTRAEQNPMQNSEQY